MPGGKHVDNAWGYNAAFNTEHSAVKRETPSPLLNRSIGNLLTSHEGSRKRMLTSSHSNNRNASQTSLTRDYNGSTPASNDVMSMLRKYAKRVEEKLKSSQGNKQMIEDIFNEIIENDPIYSDSLKLIKSFYFDSLRIEITVLKAANTKLMEEIKQLNAVNDKLICDLKAAHRIENAKLVSELNDICNQNRILKQNVFDLQKEVKRARMKESLPDRSTEKKEETVGRKCRRMRDRLRMVEVGKNKVKVPKLNLDLIADDEDLPAPCKNAVENNEL
eukprot:TRINITY_DN14957_c0_g5_i1.p1 TRINITY_DN14957_c0_g5~~TRINITY_DN14957_c0_g5_i1.p1  ORF type:complete len:275 (+),score=43.72 TRINITY_DN14957_c0_g5_i1:603-1427(+)